MIDRLLLFPYTIALALRNLRYRKGSRLVRKADVPTICVGNITVGGTGKTPHTEYILRTLMGSDRWGAKNIAMLSRGYKRTSKGFQQVMMDDSAAAGGDEPLQIKKKFPAVTVAVDKDRVEGCDFLVHPDKLESAKKARGCVNKDFPAADIIVLDDAFQYRRLGADLNVVLVDYNRPVTKDMLLPFGRLRDLPCRLNQADVILVTKCPVYLDDSERAAFAKVLGYKEYDPAASVVKDRRGRTRTLLFTCMRHGDNTPVYQAADLRYIYSQQAVLFSGIADDTPLVNFLSGRYKVVKRFNFPDHHAYVKSDVSQLVSAVKKHPTAAVVTTEKDSQRVLDYKGMPELLRERMFFIPVTVEFLTDGEKEIFDNMITSL